MNVEEMRLPLPYPDIAQMSPQAIKKALIELIQQETSEFHDALMQTVDMNLLARQRKAEAVWNTYLLSMQHIAKRNEEDLLAQIGSLFPNQTHLSAANIIDAANRSAYAILHVGVQKENFSRSNLFRAFDCDKTTRALVLDQCKISSPPKTPQGFAKTSRTRSQRNVFAPPKRYSTMRSSTSPWSTPQDIYTLSAKLMHTFPTKDEIQQAAALLADFIPRTAVRKAPSLNQGDSISFKMENCMPEILAFKVRGALYATLRLSDGERQRGLLTHSSGNHGAALAWVGKRLQVPVTVIVPDNIPASKRQNIERHGANIIACAPTERDMTAKKFQEKSGATFIHPYDNYDVITGQATAAMEFLAQQPDLKTLIVPVGGGGLLSGTLLAAHYFSKKTRVIAGEPSAVDDAYRSLQVGSIQKNITTDTVADGLRGTLGERNFFSIKSFSPTIIRVDETDILAAQKELQVALQVPVETSSAVAYAATLKGKLHGQIGVILTGGNV